MIKRDCFSVISFFVFYYNFAFVWFNNMRAVIQRVKKANVAINNQCHAKIQRGLLIFIGIESGDDFKDIEWLTDKIVKLRVFNDDKGVMNRSINEVGGQCLVVSQFTLHASTKKGNRPSYIKAAQPDIAIPIYNQFIKELETKMQNEVFTGVFGADMQVSLINDGPVTIIIDTKKKE
ncbi:MAG: D-tyrosyl-tRNA(Tyr) deacylase [Bacteroidetes bacterium ADurb.Bin234]|nr:MAG: D-tyrosyl-tRNA(Tyr) deacylase [Bacteroidetes bacterium ADurb.Bin234]